MEIVRGRLHLFTSMTVKIRFITNRSSIMCQVTHKISLENVKDLEAMKKLFSEKKIADQV